MRVFGGLSEVGSGPVRLGSQTVYANFSLAGN